MPGEKISELPVGGAISAQDIVPVVQGAQTVQTSIQAVADATYVLEDIDNKINAKATGEITHNYLNVSATLDIDVALASSFRIDLVGATVFGIHGWDVGTNEQLRTLHIFGGDVNAVTWFDIRWPNDQPPILGPEAIVVVGTIDGGVSVFGAYEEVRVPETLEFNFTDPLSTSSKVTKRVPDDFTITQVRASVTTVSSSGKPTFDLKNGSTVGTIATILDANKLTIDANEETSKTASVGVVVNTAILADDTVLQASCTNVGTGTAEAKVVVTYFRSAPPVVIPPPAFVQSVSTRSAASGDISVVLGSTITVGSLLLMNASRGQSATLPTLGSLMPTGTGGWQVLASVLDSGSNQGGQVLWYKLSDANDSQTFTANFSSTTNNEVCVMEFTGLQVNPVDTSGCLPGAVGSTYGVNDPSGSALTFPWTNMAANMLKNNSVVIALARGRDNIGVGTAPSGFTMIEQNGLGGNLVRTYPAYKITTTNTALTGLVTTWDGVQNQFSRTGIMAVFKGLKG